MTATWHQDGLDLLLKMTAGLETISNYRLNILLYYTDADFVWPDSMDDWTSRSKNAVTISRILLCSTEGTVTSLRGAMGNTFGGWATTEYFIEKTGLENAVAVGETAKPKVVIEFKR